MKSSYAGENEISGNVKDNIKSPLCYDKKGVASQSLEHRRRSEWTKSPTTSSTGGW